MNVGADFLDAIATRVADLVIERMAQQDGSSTPKRLLSLKEAGDYLGGKSASAVRHMVNDGSLPASAVKRLGTRRMFLDRIELDKFIDVQ